MAYQSIGYDKKNNTMHVWDDELGHQKFTFQPYAYLPYDNGDYISLDGTRLSKIAGNHKDNPKSYESDLGEETRTLIDLYFENDSVSKNHRELFFDIETARDENGYSTPAEARLQITSIAYYDKAGNNMLVLLLDEHRRLEYDSFSTNKYTVRIFDTERDMLTAFLPRYSIQSHHPHLS